LPTVERSIRLATLLDFFGNAFEQLERQIAPPRFVPVAGRPNFRYAEVGLKQAVVLKLARAISTLRAAMLLHENGLFQEQATLQRILDEINEDIIFLVLGIGKGPTDLHTKYLDWFYAEEYRDSSMPQESNAKPNPPRRKQIRAHIHSYSPNPSEASDAGRTISSVYSGYVHAAAPHLMDMYGGYPPKFHLAGMLNTPLEHSHAHDLLNYFYRTMASIAAVSIVFGDNDLSLKVEECTAKFAAEFDIGID
jgi:hypothetical protein